MANNWQIDLLAGLDSSKSKSQINQDIDKIKNGLKELELKAKLDTNQVKSLESQLKNLQVQLNNVTVSDAVINGLVAKINAGLQNVNISNINVGNIGNQAQQVGQQIGATIAQGVNSAIQKSGGFKSEYLFDGKNPQNKVTETVLKDFQKLSDGIITVKEQMKSVGGKSFLDGFTVSIEHATGQVETLAYKLKDIDGKTGQSFQYTGGSINDNGVIKQMNAISAKADSLQTKLDKLKANYSDVNASRPIKDSGNISALSQQYDKVTQAIENVRSADNATFSSMVSNAQREITTLESMVSQFRNAENVATQMKSVDISSGIAQAQERLAKLKANSSGFEQMTNTIRNLDIAIEGVGDKSSLDKFINDLRTAETQLSRVKAESKQLEQLNKIQLLSNGGIKNDYATQIAKLEGDFRSLGLAQDTIATKTQNVKNSLATLRAEFAKPVDQQNFQTIQTANDNLQRELIESRNEFEQLRASMKGMATEQQRLSLANTIEAWNQKNSAATRAVREENERYVSSLRDLSTQMTKTDFNKINTSFKQTENSMRALNKLGASFTNQMKQAMSSFTTWLSASTLVMKTISETREAIANIKELDNTLTEISKTSDMTSESLEKLGMSSYDTASKYGRTSSDYLSAFESMARSGFYDEVGKGMSEFSLLAQAAGDMSQEVADNYLLATNAAYKFSGDAEKLNAVLDGMNLITNRNSVALEDMASAMSKAGTTASSYNVSVEDLSAMIGTMEAVTKSGGDEVGNSLKSILINLQNVTSSKIVGTLDKANASMTTFVNGTEKLRNPIEILRDLAKTFNELDKDDPLRAEILTNIGGKICHVA